MDLESSRFSSINIATEKKITNMSFLYIHQVLVIRPIHVHEKWAYIKEASIKMTLPKQKRLK